MPPSSVSLAESQPLAGAANDGKKEAEYGAAVSTKNGRSTQATTEKDYKFPRSAERKSLKYYLQFTNIKSVTHLISSETNAKNCLRFRWHNKEKKTTDMQSRVR